MRIERDTIKVDESNKNMYELEGKIVVSHPKGGCGMGHCNCSPGHWISMIEPIQDGEIKITKFVFDSREELDRHIDMEMA